MVGDGVAVKPPETSPWEVSDDDAKRDSEPLLSPCGPFADVLNGLVRIAEFRIRENTISSMARLARDTFMAGPWSSKSLTPRELDAVRLTETPSYNLAMSSKSRDFTWADGTRIETETGFKLTAVRGDVIGDTEKLGESVLETGSDGTGDGDDGASTADVGRGETE